MLKGTTKRAAWLLSALVLVAGLAAADSHKKPNILVIMADDVGWSDLGVYHQGVMSNQTPNLDRLAAEGMRFVDYYAQPSCTAGRSAFITGQFPVRSGLHTVGLPGDPARLSDEDPTLATLLRKMGYTTGQFGKNHLGDIDEALPTMHGFDEYWGWLYHLNAMEYTDDPDFPQGPEGEQFRPRNVVHSWSTGPGTQRIEDDGPLPPKRQKTVDKEVLKHTTAFIEKAVREGKPFFTWMAPARAHIFSHFSPEYEAMYGENGFGMSQIALKELDDTVGSVLAKLDELGITDNTIVLFTSDNGPELITWPDGGMTPFRGEKGTTWEGGFRVPAIIRWPGHVPQGVVTNEIFDSMDWLPTLVAAAGGPTDLPAKLKQGYEGYKVHLDGYNQLGLITGAGPSKRKEIVYYEGTTLQALRYENWKAHFIIQPEGWFGPKQKLNGALLFNLRQDPFERTAAESGNYVDFLAHKMWAFGPAKRLIQRHLATFQEFPSRRVSAVSNQGAMKEEAKREHKFSQ